MCQLKSGIALKDRIYVPDHDNYEQMLQELGLKDNYSGASEFVSWELLPPYGDLRTPVEEWILDVDQNITPDWWDEDARKPEIVQAVEAWAKEHIIREGVREVRGGMYYACGDSRVMAKDGSEVTAWGNSKVVAYDNSQVTARKNSQVTARDYSYVIAMENSKVEAFGSSYVMAWGNRQVTAWDDSQVTVFGNTQIEALDNSIIICPSTKTISVAAGYKVEIRQ